MHVDRTTPTTNHNDLREESIVRNKEATLTPELSLARGQRSLGSSEHIHPLRPLLFKGCPHSTNSRVQIPLEVLYDYDQVEASYFNQPPLAGMLRWQKLLPPLEPELSMGEGGTPLLSGPKIPDLECEYFVKDESRNPTWSHKDRLNYCTVSAAIHDNAPGIVVASSGNHGASAAAYAARTGLPCVVLMSNDAPQSIRDFIGSYGATVLAVPSEKRWENLRQIHEEYGFHPVSNLTATHTGHPFGPEGYKTIAYELYAQLGNRVPGAVFIPTGYAEVLYGVWKGFKEINQICNTGLPKMISCEPESRAPLAKALATNDPTATSLGSPSCANSIANSVGGLRGMLAVQESNGLALTLSEDEIKTTQQQIGRKGLWYEYSAVAGIAALRKYQQNQRDITGPVVCLATSSGFKYHSTQSSPVKDVDGSWESVKQELVNADITTR